MKWGILKFGSVPMFLYAAINFVNQTAFSSKHVSTFLPRNNDVISHLRHSYAKGTFCVTRLIFTVAKRYFGTINVTAGIISL